jgi:hypothetical protein
MPALFLLVPTFAFSQKFEETTNKKNIDSDFVGGYTKDELDRMAMAKEQRAIMDKFMKGRYSSAVDGTSRYSGIMEYHDNNFDGITEHDGANNAAESSGDLVGLGQKGLTGNARLKAMIVERINSSGNCELTKDDNENIKNNNFAAVKGAIKGKSWKTIELANELLPPNWNTLLDISNNQLSVKATTDPDQEKAAKALYRKFLDERKKLRYFEERDASGNLTGNFLMQCPNVSAIVLDKGAAHDSSTGSGHRVYALNEKTFKAGTGPDGPFGNSAEGETTKVADEYVAAVLRDSGTTAIPPEVIAAMRAQGMDISASADGRTVTVTNPNGTRTLAVGASLDDLKSEFAWLEAQKKHRLNETWKSLRAERFIAGDNYDPANVSSEIGSLLAQHADKTEAERDKIVAEKVAEHNIYNSTKVCLRVSGGTAGVSIGAPQTCPPAGGTPIVDARLDAIRNNRPLAEVCPAATPGICYLRASASELRDQAISSRVLGVMANDLTQVAINAAKSAAASGLGAADLEKNKARLTERVQDCMSRGKWCEQVQLRSFKEMLDIGTQPAQVLTAINNDDKLKGRGITIDDVKAGTAYLEAKGDPGNAFKDTREFIAAQMETAMEGPLSQFLNTVRSADFSEATDAKTGTNNFAIVKQQWEQNMQMARDVRAYAEAAYQECLQVRGLNCERQFNDNNFNVNSMNTVELFGRNTSRDGSTTGLDPTQLFNETPGLGGGGQGFTSPAAQGLQPRAPANNAPLPLRGSAPPPMSSPFSMN